MADRFTTLVACVTAIANALVALLAIADSADRPSWLTVLFTNAVLAAITGVALHLGGKQEVRRG